MKKEPIVFTKSLFVCFVLYVTCLFASNTLGLKLMPFLFGTHLSVAVFFFPVVFIMTDIVGEVYGKKYSKLFVYGGFLSIVLYLSMSIISNVMPWSNESLWVKDSYNTVFSISFRMSIASLFAFIIAEYQDVFVFFATKKYFGEKFLWLRSLISNTWSQFLDTTIWTLIAFVGIYSSTKIITIIIPWFLYKVIMGFLYTPLIYYGKYLLIKFKNNEN